MQKVINNQAKNKSGFSLVEFLVVVGIIAILVTMVVVSLSYTRKKARDAKRKVEISQIGRFLSLSCYLPNAGAGDYDLVEIISELKIKYPQASKILAITPKDPRVGTQAESFYRYVVLENAKQCALYANLENNSEDVTIKDITKPTPGAGVGVFDAISEGWNNSALYFQYSN